MWVGHCQKDIWSRKTLWPSGKEKVQKDIWSRKTLWPSGKEKVLGASVSKVDADSSPGR